VLQAAILECGSFDPFSFQQDGLGASEVDVSRGEIAQALVIAAMVVVVDEGVDLGFQAARQIIVLKQDAVLERLMPALDLALRLRVAGRAAHVTHIAFVQPFGGTGDQAVLLQKAIDLSFRDKIVVSVKRAASSRCDSSGSSRACSSEVDTGSREENAIVSTI
jgi:hypothetical protein